MLLQTILFNNTPQPPSLSDQILLLLVGLGLLLLLLIVGLWLLRKYLHHDVNHTILLLTVPRFDSDQKDKEYDIKNHLGQIENLFSALGSLKAEKGIATFFTGRNDHLSVEIVARQGEISFYAAVPAELKDFFVQQLQSVYPAVHVKEVEDYNIFKAQMAIGGSYLKGKRSYVFPFKTYAAFEFDPLETLVTALSKLEEGDGIAIQYIIRSAHGTWHTTSLKVANALHEGKKVNEAVSQNQLGGGLVRLIASSIFSSFSKSKDAQGMEMQKRSQPSQANLNIAESIESKANKAGFDVNIRVISSSVNQLRVEANLRNVINAYGQYNLYEIGNSFKATQIQSRDKIIRDFIYRRFNDKARLLLNAEELVSMWHLPGEFINAPNIRWLEARKATPPRELPSRGIILGDSDYRGQKVTVRIKDDDRLRHMYIIGQTGTGKTTLMKNMVLQDIRAGNGCCVMDPHGDLAEYVLNNIPPERAEDVIVFDPSDVARPLGLNLLEFQTDDQKTFVVNEIIKIFDKLYDLSKTGGPMFEQYMRNTILLMMEDVESGSTLLEISKVLADEDFRRYKLSKAKNPVVRDFWLKEAHKAGGEAALQNMVPYITSKLTQFISNDIMRPIISQQKSSFNFRQLMDEKKIICVNLSKGKIGDMNSNLLGMVIVGKILMAALSRVDIPEEQRNAFYLYMDEFQNFTTDSIAVILSEARKYKLGLIIAHQYISQLVKDGNTQVRDAVFGNVGTKVSYRIGVDDAEFLAKEFAPVFNEYDLVNIPSFNAYIKLLIDNQNLPAFNMSIHKPLAGDPNRANKIKEMSRLKYGRPREEIEAEIQERSKIQTKKIG